jgi:hypothetical protein
LRLRLGAFLLSAAMNGFYGLKALRGNQPADMAARPAPLAVGPGPMIAGPLEEAQRPFPGFACPAKEIGSVLEAR